MADNRCPTTGCKAAPDAGFTYCRDHAGSEREAYATLMKAEAERDRLREQFGILFSVMQDFADGHGDAATARRAIEAVYTISDRYKAEPEGAPDG